MAYNRSHMDFWTYWRPLAKKAAADACAFGNDWQWLIGVPAFAALLYFAKDWLGPDPVNAQTVLGALLLAAAAFAITWLGSFAVRLARAPVAQDQAKSKQIAD